MNMRTFIVSLIGGAINTLLLAVPMFIVIPAAYTPDWPQINPVLGIFAALLAVLNTIGVGFLVVRWAVTGAAGDDVAQSSLSGIIATLVAWIVVGPASAGLLGHTPIWNHGIHAANSEGTVALLIIQSALETNYWHYGLFWYTLIAGALLGLIGGYFGHQGFTPSQQYRQPIPLRVWKMVVLSMLCVLLLQMTVMPGIYALMIAQFAQSRATYALTDDQSLNPLLLYPKTMIYLGIIIVVRWGWYLIALERTRVGVANTSPVFRVIVILFTFTALAIDASINTQRVQPFMNLLGWIGIVGSMVFGMIHTYWIRHVADPHTPNPALRWYDWLSAILLSAIVCTVLIELITTGFALSMVMISIVVIGDLSGAEPTVPAVATIISELITTQQVGIFVGSSVPLFLLPFFLLYTWIRGIRTAF